MGNFFDKVWRNAEEFASLAERLPEETPEQGFADEKYGTYQRNIDGMTELAYHHLGQITRSKKCY